jgi:large subunit ribosomal protein L29
MAIIKKKELKALPAADREKKLKELRAELAKEMSKKATGGAPTKPSSIGNIKRTIAKLLTPVANSKDVNK